MITIKFLCFGKNASTSSQKPSSSSVSNSRSGEETHKTDGLIGSSVDRRYSKYPNDIQISGDRSKSSDFLSTVHKSNGSRLTIIRPKSLWFAFDQNYGSHSIANIAPHR